jgi:hypothetical protein
LRNKQRRDPFEPFTRAKDGTNMKNRPGIPTIILLSALGCLGAAKGYPAPPGLSTGDEVKVFADNDSVWVQHWAHGTDAVYSPDGRSIDRRSQAGCRGIAARPSAPGAVEVLPPWCLLQR